MTDSERLDWLFTHCQHATLNSGWYLYLDVDDPRAAIDAAMRITKPARSERPRQMPAVLGARL